MYEKLRNTIDKYQLIESGDDILLGLSGGVDSVALFYGLLEYQNECNFHFRCVHLNHAMREEATDEEMFCEALCKANGIEFISETSSMEQYSIENSLSIEEAGRELRKKIYRKYADSETKIALGHHQDDQIETILMNFLRGTGPEGLIGMEIKGNQIIRPLLYHSKKELIDYLEKHNYMYCIDKSNLDNRFRRNKIRNYLIPLLEKEFNPKIKNAIQRLEQIQRIESKYIMKKSEEPYQQLMKIYDESGILSHGLLDQETAIQRRIIIRWVHEKLDLTDINYHLIQSLLELFQKEISKKYDFQNMRFIKTYEGIYVERIEKQKKSNPQNFTPGKLNIFHNISIKSDILSIDEYHKINKKNSMFFDIEILKDDLILRTREKGDLFKPYGMKGKKKLKDFFIDEKIPQFLRDKIPLLVGKNDIYAIIGHRRGAAYPVTDQTKEVLMIERIE